MIFKTFIIFASIFVYYVNAGGPSFDDCTQPQLRFNAVLPGFTEHVANETANAIQKIDAYAAANSSQSSEEFRSGIQNIINSTSEGFRDCIIITDIFSEVKLQDKKQYFFDGSTGTYPLSCLDQNSLKTIIDNELTSAKDYANKIINAH